MQPRCKRGIRGAELLLVVLLELEGKTTVGAWSKTTKKHVADGHHPAEDKMKKGKFSNSCGCGCVINTVWVPR